MTSRPSSEWRRRLAEVWSSDGERLYRMARGILRDAALAADVCQEAFLKALQQEGQLHDVSRPRAWLTRVVANESLLALRRRRLGIRARERAADARARPPGDSELRAAVLEAVANLPEPNGLIVVLRVMEGWSGNEVKELLGCSAAEVSRRLYLGMEQLRHTLREHAPAHLRRAAHGS